MQKIKELFSQITKKAWIITGIVLVGVLIGIVCAVMYSKNQTIWPVSLFTKNDSPQELDASTNEFVSDATAQIFTKEDVARGEYKNDTQSATVYVNNTQEVQIAVVADIAAQKVISDTKNISCGQVTFVTARVMGPAVLTNSLKALFEDKVPVDFAPGNIIPTYHPELVLEKVVIEAGVAKVYLGGNFSGKHDGWCDASLALAQITETAKTFQNVTSVEVYQAGNKIY